MSQEELEFSGSYEDGEKESRFFFFGLCVCVQVSIATGRHKKKEKTERTGGSSWWWPPSTSMKSVRFRNSVSRANSRGVEGNWRPFCSTARVERAQGGGGWEERRRYGVLGYIPAETHRRAGMAGRRWWVGFSSVLAARFRPTATTGTVELMYSCTD